MPDNYLDSSIVGFNHQDALDLQVDTYKRLSPILNMEDKPAIDERFAMNLSILQEGTSDKIPDVQRINMGAALISDDPIIKSAAQKALKGEVDKDPEFKYGLGRAIESPYNDYSKKFFDKEFGYSALRDNEDFYYNNTWGEMSIAGRMWRTPFKMVARIIPQAVLKIGSGLGYVGSMITSLGNDNYWADVADNAFSNWFNEKEQAWKDQVIPVYKQAGFDEKGFFSKVFDSAFWNDEVADGIAFMASAAVPGMGISKLGRLGAAAGELNTFGKAFSTANTLGKAASKVGMGSWAELSSWTFNTAMESAVEGAGVFKEMKRRLEAEREEGLNDLTDEEIRKRAGYLAGNTVAGNFAVLALSNAWENTLFFKPFKNVKGKASVGLKEDFTGFSRTVDNLEKKSPFASSLSRTNFYGKQLAAGFVAEGLWEENAQLAIQRINQGDNEGRGFVSQLSKQTIDAFTGKDKEASESIGLGALIGMGASVVFSKMGNERKSILENTRQAIQSVNAARQNLFDTTDVYERDTDNNIVYENNIPKLSQAKLLAKQKALETEYGKITLSNDEKYYQSEPVKFETRRALANYVRSLNKIGVKDVSARLANISPQQSTLFGMNPTAINKDSSEFAGIARQFEDISDDVEDIYVPPISDNTTRKSFIIDTENRKAEIYSRRTDNVILSNFIVDSQSQLLKSLNEYRKLQNASIAQFPVDQLNGLIIQERDNKQMMDSDYYKQMSDLEKEYHIQRDKELKELITSYKKNNELTLQDTIQTENGFYKPTITDSNGNKKPVEFDTRSVNLQRSIANHSNSIDKNSYIDRLISNKDNGHSNFMKLQNDQLDKQITEAILATEKKKTKYKEINKGDFEKVTKLVAKMVFGENQQYSPEELQLQQNYTDLISEILPQYEVAVEQQRLKNFENRLSTLRNTQAATASLIVKRGTEIDDQKLDLLILQEELEKLAGGKRADRKKVTDAINSLSVKIEEAEKGLASEREKLSLITEQIELLESEIAGGNFRGLYGALQELKKERVWAVNELARTSALLDKVKKIVKDIIKVASRLIPNFSYKNLDRILGDDVYGSKNKEAYDPSVVQAYEEIKGRVNETADLEKTIEGLKQVIPELNAKYEDDKRQVNDILAQVDKYFADLYLDTTKKAPAKIDAETETITKNLTADKGLFPNGNNSGGNGFTPEDGFDGSTYQRPLHTKFFTSTFPDYRNKKIRELPKDVQDYFDFVEFLTNENNSKKIKDKLGEGDVKVLVVTRNNYKELGLEGVLSDRVKFFESEDPTTTHVELIPVIEDGGDFYYTDKDLNKLSKLDGKKPEKNIVRTVLRLPRFTAEEQAQYSVKYSQEDMNAAVKVAVDWRKDLLKQTTDKQVVTMDFDISRGIPNQQKVEGDGIARNPVTEVLLPEKKINGQSVRVFASSHNEEFPDAILPIGRPFIYTNNGIHPQLHAADNTTLSTGQLAVVNKVFHEMIKDHLDKVMKIVNAEKSPVNANLKKRIEEVGIANLNNSEKKALYLQLTKNKPSLFNTNYTNFLSTIIYFNKLEKDDNGKYKTPGKNQVYMDGFMFVLGTSGNAIDMTNPADVLSPEVQEFFKGQYHNIKYFTTATTANKQHLEYYLDGDKLQVRTWKTYAHYLLSPKFPDGGKRVDIPITTSIKTKEQHDLEKGDDPYYAYLSRGIIVKNDAIPAEKKKVVTKPKPETPTKKEKAKPLGTDPASQLLSRKRGKEEVIVTDSEETSMDAASALLAKKKGQQKPEEKKEAPKGDAAAQMLAKKKVPKPDEDIPDFDTDEGNSLPMDSAFRLARGGAFKMEEDLDALVADIKRMIPQFPVERLRNTIKVTDGIEAWGQFTNNMIYLYEKAEKGTGYHEVFEAVVNKLLTDPEWRAIYKEFTSRKGSFQDRETGEYLTYAAATPHQAKEQMAEEFMDYKLTGKLPTQNQTRSFFKIIWDFIKTYILNRPTISGIFAKIDQGKFAKTSVRETDRFAESYRKLLPELKAKVKKDLADGASAFIFNNLFLTPESLVQLDEKELTDEQIYEPVKVKFQETITGLQGLIQTEIAKKSGANQKLVQDYKNAISYITYSLNNWGDFVAFHKERLKPFRIRFEQSFDKSEDEKEKENRNDYLNDEFKTSGKKSASKSIRFLFGTLIEKRFDQAGETLKVGNTITGKTVNARTSSVLMPSLVDYDKYMLNALEEFTGISDFSTMEEKLKALAGITEIENTKNPEKRAELIAGLPSEKAVWTSLYLRLFGTSQHVDEESAMNLKVKFHNYGSKHSPTPFVYIYGAGNSSIIESVKRSSFESLVRTIESSIISQRDLIFSTVRKGGRITFTANKQFKNELKFAEFKENKYKKFIEYLGLDTLVDDTFINSLSPDEKNQLISKLLKIRNALSKVNTPTLDLKGMNIFGYMTRMDKNVADEGLIPFLDRKLKLSELGTQFFNIENQPQQRHITPSYISRIVGDINNLSKADLLEKYPQLDNFFSQNSLMMERLYDEEGNRTSEELSLGYMEGIKDIDENEGTKSSRLELHDKYWLQFNATLAGLHYSLPADSETEWVFNMGEFVKYSENMLDERGQSIVDEIFIPYLKTEIETAIASGDNLLQFNSIHPSTGKTIGKSLRFFKNILSNNKKLLADIHNSIEKGENPNKIISSNRAKIRASVLAFLNGEVENTIDTLKDYRLVRQDEEGYTLNSLDNKFVEANRLKSDQGYTVLTEGQFKGVVQYQKVNSIIGLMEQFKLFYGDPAQYKDWEKRAKSLFGPVEQTFTDKNNTLNNWLNINKNSAVLGDEKIELAADDWFRRDYSNKLKSRTVDDILVVAVETTNDLQDIINNGTEEEAAFVSKFISAYSTNSKDEAQINEVDGQSVGTLGFARELMTKSGWRWTKEMEDYYQYDSALLRQDLSKLTPNSKHYYNYGDNQALRDLDAKIVEYYKVNPPTNPITPVKTLMPSVDVDGNQILLKHAVYFASYNVAKDFELLDTYVDMLKRGDDLLNFKSAQKIGHLVDDEGKVTNYYSDPFTKTDLDSKGNPQFEIDYRTIGIQVETQTSSKKQTIGTQMTKDINLNLFEGGVPTDFGGLSTKDSWDLLSEEEKLSQSENYRLVKGDDGTIKTLEALKRKNAIDTLSKLGINWTVSPSGELLFNIDNLTKLKQFIHDEMRRLEVDENTMDNIELAEDLKSFLNPAETLPSYNTISNLLWSMADKATASIKVNGKPYIQVSSAFFNKGSRKAAYKDENGKWIEVDTKSEYDRLVAEGKKMVMTSSELKFYRKGEDGKTLPMEIYLPHIYKQKINDRRKSKNLPPLTDQQLMDHLNANPRLLEGVGFRIPTQATSSLEFFKIKGFLPENFGSAVVVPSAITTKGGSDFDVDKLNTYLNNWKLDKDGLPFYEEYKDNTNSTEQDRYISFVKGTERNFNAILQDMKASSEYKDVAEVLDENRDELITYREMMDIAKSEQEETYYEGLDIFRDLPKAVKQQFYEKERELRAANIDGAEKTLEYLAYTKNWVKAFDEGKALELPYQSEVRGKLVNSSDTVYPQDVLPVFNQLTTNYTEFLNKIGVTSELINEYLELKASNRAENVKVLQSFRFEVAKVIAEFNGVISYDQFNKLPMYLQNTKGALENRYFTSLRNVLESPDMFKYLLSPNSISHIRENRDAVYDALEIQAEDKKELDYTRFLSTEYISEKRNSFTKGKTDIGIFAVAMTNFANSQVTGIGISELGSIKEMDSYVFDELNDSRIDLPFEDVPMQYVGDSWFIPLSVVKDKEGKYTMDKISAYINGAVDVAKEPLIIEMGMHTELASVYMLMERMGLTGKTTALFLYQPSIREYLKELLFLEKKTYFGTSKYDFTTEMMKGVLSNYSGADVSYDPDYKFTDEQLVELIRKGEKVKKGTDNWTESELKAQRLALTNFLKMKMFGNHLLENIQSSNHDTSSIRSSYSLLRKDLQLERSQKGNMIMKIDGENLINGGEALIDETFVKTDIIMMKMFNSLFSNIGLFSLQKTNPKKTLTTIARRIFNNNPFITNDDFLRTMRDYESSIIDILTNDVHIETEVEGKLYSNKLYQFADQFFNPDRAGNIRSRFNEVKKKQEDGDFIYDKFIKNNFFLSNLNIYFDKESGLDLMELKVKPGNDAVLTKERLTEGLRSVLTIDESKFPEMAALGRAIVNAAFIQFGIRYGRDSFVDLIPSEDLKQLTGAALENIDNEDFKNLDEQVQRSRSSRKNVVPETMHRTLHFISPNPNNSAELILENNQRAYNMKSWKNPPTKQSQTFFGVYDGEKIVPSIHPAFIWGGYKESPKRWEDMPNIISIPAVRPEYLIVKETDKGISVVPDKAEIDKMKKKGDYSYLFNQLYKKVGVEDNSLAREIISGGKKKSINYLYKPINKYGTRKFNEQKPLLTTPENTVMGEPSIIDFPPFVELDDNELIALFNNVGNRVQPVFRPKFEEVSNTLKPKNKAAVSTRDSIQMSEDNVTKIKNGTKTTTIRSISEGSKIRIKSGETAKRFIGDIEYNVTNRGYLTIEEAGGIENVAKSEGLPTSPVGKNKIPIKVGEVTYYAMFNQTKDWMNGLGKMYIYDIRPIQQPPASGGTIVDDIKRIPNCK